MSETMFSDPRQIIKSLESAIELHKTTNSAIQRDTAKMIVVASRHALQALSLEFAYKRFPLESSKIIEVSNGRSRISKDVGHEKHSSKNGTVRKIK